ncbi:oxidation resistance protein 1 isoform X2 [Oryza brachyantha]|nr:oxidation resistance protein 1 isoform X2 [Oryza brachyantha]
MMSLLPTSISGHERTSPSSMNMKPLPPESLPKRWRGNDFLWCDQPLELSEESGYESEGEKRNGNSDNEQQILQSYRSRDNSNGNEETSTSDCIDSLCYLTEKSRFVSPKLFGFFQSSLPGTLRGCHWVLLYSTWKHGISLRTLFRRSENLQGPCLLIVGDMQGAVFGGLLNGPLRPTEKRKYQGTNQTFVFTTISGEPRLFRPTGANRYYYLCLNNCLAFGGGGNFALCLDEDLLHGTSGLCETFGNSCLAHSPDFELKNVEPEHRLPRCHLHLLRLHRQRQAREDADNVTAFQGAAPAAISPPRRRRGPSLHRRKVPFDCVICLREFIGGQRYGKTEDRRKKMNLTGGSHVQMGKKI